MNFIKKAILGICATLVIGSSFANEKPNNDINESEIKSLSEKINIQFKKNENNYSFLKQEGDNKKFEVVYFFSYGCPYCYHFDPLISEWKNNIKDDISFIKVPATFQDGWDVLANAYTIKEKLKLPEDFDENIFKSIHEKKYDLKNFDSLRSYFINNYNVDYTTFNKEYNSFSTVSKKNEYDKWADELMINGTPTVAIITKDGNVYETSTGMTGDDLSTIVSIEYIIRQLREGKDPVLDLEKVRDEQKESESKPVLQ